jgi:hypothetical protein
MSDWEDDSKDTPVPVIAKPVKKWDDEDIDEDAIKVSFKTFFFLINYLLSFINLISG